MYDLRAGIDKALRASLAREHNYIIRPRPSGTQIIQLDDLDKVKVDCVAPDAFMVLETSPGRNAAEAVDRQPHRSKIDRRPR